MLSQAKVSAIEEELQENGYIVVDLPDVDVINETRAWLQERLAGFLGLSSVELETYHELELDDDTHYATHVKMVDAFRAESKSRKIAERQLDMLVPLLGKDLAITVPDILRMVRPGKGFDNIGLHRDSDYGNTAYELNFWIPFVDIAEGMGLQVVPKSHMLTDDALTLTKSKHELVKESSDLHRIGFFHTPQHIQDVEKMEKRRIPVKVGQALIFPANLVHGQDVNEGPSTRWTTDFEVGNSLGPIQWYHRDRNHLKYRVLTETFAVSHGRQFGPDTGVPENARTEAIRV